MPAPRCPYIYQQLMKEEMIPLAQLRRCALQSFRGFRKEVSPDLVG